MNTSLNIAKLFGMKVTKAESDGSKFIFTCHRDGIDNERGVIMRKLAERCELEDIYFSSQVSKKEIKYRIPYYCMSRVEFLYEQVYSEHHALKSFNTWGD
jgi:hypothetical protein